MRYPSLLLALQVLALSPAFAQLDSVSVPRFKHAPALPAAKPAAPAAPEISFNGATLKTFLFSDQDRIAPSLAAAIGKAQGTLNAALYELTLPEVTQALIDAKNRGVVVKVIMDYGHAFPTAAGQTRSPEIDRLIAEGVELRVLKGTGAHGIMHNKFAVIDGQLLETGSFNWTIAANTQNYENAVFRQDPALISGFGSYWDWMWAQAKPMADAAGLQDSSGAPPADSGALIFKGKAWPAYVFSPNGGAEARIVEAINACESSVDIAMFSFFSFEIAKALVAARDKGRTVRVVMDRSQSQHSHVTPFFAKNGIDFKLLSGIGGQGVLHDKFGVYDRELVETGSFNYSNNANVNNFENSVYLTSPEDVAGYQAEFDSLYSLGQAAKAEDIPTDEQIDAAEASSF